jgi:hypothetical protein
VLIDTVKQKIDAQNSADEVVISKLKEDQEEAEEQRRRRANIIVHGLRESMAPGNEERAKGDEDSVVDLLHTLKCDKVSVVSAYRLGKRHAEPEKNPRPLKIVVASEEQKEQVLFSTKNLKGLKVWEKVILHQDLTPRQRERRQQLVKELRRRREAGDDNLMIVNNRIVTRRHRPESAEEEKD